MMNRFIDQVFAKRMNLQAKTYKAKEVFDGLLRAVSILSNMLHNAYKPLPNLDHLLRSVYYHGSDCYDVLSLSHAQI